VPGRVVRECLHVVSRGHGLVARHCAPPTPGHGVEQVHRRRTRRECGGKLK
jgi:hypothetical protein